MPSLRTSFAALRIEPGATETLPPRAHFLEHVYDRRSRSATDEVIVGYGEVVYRSTDLGVRWDMIDLAEATGGLPVVRCFTLDGGNRLLQTGQTLRTVLVDSDWKPITTCSTGPYCWHGTWSIDQNLHGTVIYGEYHNLVKAAQVWRSADGGLTWVPVLTCRGLLSKSPEIRHFHTCQADPFTPGRWIVSSGDLAEHCRIWVSEDDGLSWTEAAAPELAADSHPRLSRPRRAYRFTAPAFTPDSILWPTDDTLGVERAALVVAHRAAPAALRITGLLGRNEMRALIQVAPDAWLAISESKLDPRIVDIYLVDANYAVHALPGLVNAAELKSGFTRSICSKAARNGVFFSFDDGGVLEPDCRFIRFQIEIFPDELARLRAEQNSSDAPALDPRPRSAPLASPNLEPAEATSTLEPNDHAGILERLETLLREMVTLFGPDWRSTVGRLDSPNTSSAALPLPALAAPNDSVPASPLVPGEKPQHKSWIRDGVAWFANPEGRSVSARHLADIFDNVEGFSQISLLREQMLAYAATGSRGGLDALLAGRIFLTRDAKTWINIDDFDWRQPRIFDRSQLWQLQQWMSVRDCLYEYVNSGYTHAILRLAPLLRSWVDANLNATALTEDRLLAWHDHATALRVIHFVLYIHLLQVAGYSVRTEFPRLGEFVAVHLIVLLAEDFYSRSTNHGFDQATALYLLSSIFDLGELTRGAAEIARQRLTDEVSIAFTEEGVHIENSPGYHPIMLSRLLNARDMLDAFGDGTSSRVIEGIYDKGLDFLIHALKPDGTLPRIGDTQSLPLRFDIARGENAGRLRYALSAGREGVRPEHNVRIFPRSGYGFIRDLWHDAHDYHQAMHVSVKSGFHSTYHRHDDDNNVLLYAFGEDWLIDNGIFKYEEKDPYRRYVRSSFAHNIVSVSGVEPVRQVAEPKLRSGFMKWGSNQGITELELRSVMYPGFVYERQVKVDRRRCTLELRDHVRPRTAQLADFVTCLHFPADKQVEITGAGKVDITSKATGRRLRVTVEGDGETITLASGAKEPDIAGWTSPQLGALQPCWTVFIKAWQKPRFQGVLFLNFETGG